MGRDQRTITVLVATPFRAAIGYHRGGSAAQCVNGFLLPSNHGSSTDLGRDQPAKQERTRCGPVYSLAYRSVRQRFYTDGGLQLKSSLPKHGSAAEGDGLGLFSSSSLSLGAGGGPVPKFATVTHEGY